MPDWLKFRLVSFLGYWAMRAIGCTLRWEIDGLNHLAPAGKGNEGRILAFWHGRIFLATYYFRNRGIVVMTSRNRDGEYIARVIRRFGYVPARGSSSRGGRAALVEMIRALREGADVGFTMDGPRGPRHVAKPGAVWVAARTGRPICAFHLCAERKWELSSWDRFQIPKPFSRVYVTFAPPIMIPGDAGETEIERFRSELQGTMEDLVERGDGHWRACGPSR